MSANPDKKVIEAAMRIYKRDHWGQTGPWDVRRLTAADPRLVSVALGELVSVVYRTKKGRDRELTDYEHPFSRPLPVLAYHGGGLLILGGKYRVTERGIID
jgi:hypothetical protein